MRSRKLEHQALRGRWAAITYQVLSGFLARAVVAVLRLWSLSRSLHIRPDLSKVPRKKLLPAFHTSL